MLGVLFASVTALSFGATGVLSRVGLVGISVQAGTTVSLAASLALAVVAVLVFDPGGLQGFPWEAMGYFGVIGVANYLGGRQLNFLGVARLGAARATAITAASPIVSMVLAVLLLGEPFTVPIVLGTFMVVGGIVLVVSEQ